MGIAHQRGSWSIRMPSLANFILRRESAIVSLLFFLAPFITLLAPLTTVPALILLSAGCVGIAFVHGQSPREIFRFDLGLALFTVVTLYLLINATWSLDLPRALDKILLFGLVVVMAFGASRAVSRWDQGPTRVAVIAFLAGVTAGLVFILFELATEQGLTRLLFSTFPVTRPDSLKAMRVQDGRVVAIAAFELNRNVAVLLLMLWSALLCLSRLTDKGWRTLGISAFFAAAAVAIMISEHETSMIGLVFATIVFLAAWRWPTPARWGMLVLWCLAFVLVVPLSTLAVKEQLYQAEWLPYSARSRLTLWAYTAEKIPEAPFFGVGLGSARELNVKEKLGGNQKVIIDPLQHGRRVLAWKTGPHSHNEFLQTWFELGAVGVVLLLAAGCVVIGYIGRLSPATQPFVLAQFAAFFTIAAFSWGMWQSWLLAVTGLTAIYAALAATFARAGVRAADDLAAEGTPPVRPHLAPDERPA